MKQRNKRRRNRISTCFFVLVFLAGLSVMLYPTISNYINTKHQSYVIARYDETMNQMDDTDCERFLAEAEAYNHHLQTIGSPLYNYKQAAGYAQTLDITGTGIMGYISIPQLQIQLPIYHGTSDEVLNIACGHLEGSTLPVGGTSTHAVLSAHRGLPSAKLFSDLDKLVTGDIFTVTILNQVLTYEIDQISIVQPYDYDQLSLVSGKDYITLLTCTPYGINTHRLLVRGVRIASEAPELLVRVSSDAVQIEPMAVASIAIIPLLILSFSEMIIAGSLRRKREKQRRSIMRKGR